MCTGSIYLGVVHRVAAWVAVWTLPSSVQLARASCPAESCSLVFAGLLISPGQMLVGLMSVDKAGTCTVSLPPQQLARAGQAKQSREEASLAMLQCLLLAALAGWGCAVRRPCPCLGRPGSRSERMLLLAT